MIRERTATGEAAGVVFDARSDSHYALRGHSFERVTIYNLHGESEERREAILQTALGTLRTRQGFLLVVTGRSISIRDHKGNEIEVVDLPDCISA